VTTTKRLIKSTKKVDSVFCYVKRVSVIFASWNPPARTDMRNIRGLVESMKADGFWPYCPVLIGADSVLIDGHRRLTAAGLAGVDDIPAIVVDAPAQEVWADINQNRASLTGAQFLQAVSLGLDYIPPRMERLYTILIELIGEVGLRRLAEKNIGPAIYRNVKRISVYCGQENDQGFMRDLLWWLVNYKGMQKIVEQAMKNDVRPEVILEAVTSNRPLAVLYDLKG
jgi:hypothetical protein